MPENNEPSVSSDDDFDLDFGSESDTSSALSTSGDNEASDSSQLSLDSSGVLQGSSDSSSVTAISTSPVVGKSQSLTTSVSTGKSFLETVKEHPLYLKIGGGAIGGILLLFILLKKLRGRRKTEADENGAAEGDGHVGIVTNWPGLDDIDNDDEPSFSATNVSEDPNQISSADPGFPGGDSPVYTASEQVPSGNSPFRDSDLTIDSGYPDLASDTDDFPAAEELPVRGFNPEPSPVNDRW